MDIGKFKANRGRLFLWILLPPLLLVSSGLGAYLLRLRSDWDLVRTERLAEVLPKLVQSRRQGEALVGELDGGQSARVRSEDEFVSFLLETARESGFTIDSHKVERGGGKAAPVLTASVKGTGSFEDIQRFLGDASAAQHLLSEKSLQVLRGERMLGNQACKADIVFEMALFDASGTMGGKGE